MLDFNAVSLGRGIGDNRDKGREERFASRFLREVSQSFMPPCCAWLRR